MSFIKQIRELWDHLRGKGPAAAVALTLDLGEARDNKPYMLEAGAVFVERCDGDLYARVNGPNGDGMSLRYVKKILYPVSSLYLTNTAQAGKSARLLLLPTGMDADPPGVKILGDLDDVEISAPSDGEVLTYETLTALWKNKAPTGGPPTLTYQFVEGTTDVNTLSTTPVDMPDMTLTVAQSGTYLILFSANCTISRTTGIVMVGAQFQLLQDATVLCKSQFSVLLTAAYAMGLGGCGSMATVKALTAGQVLKVQWQVSSGTLYNRPVASYEHRTLTIVRLG